MCEIDKDSLCDEIYRLKKKRDEVIKPIEERYQSYIDKVIFQKLQFPYNCILKNELIGKNRYFIYRGIKQEHMVLYGCDENGVYNKVDRQYPWSAYEDFEIHKEKLK